MREAASRRGHCEGDRKADPRPAFWEVPPSADPRSPSAGPMPWLRATPAPPEGTRQSPTSSSMSLSPSVGSQSVGSASASQRPGAGPALSPRGRRAVAGTGAGPTPAGSRGSRTRLCVHLRQAAPNQTEAGERDQTCPARARGRRASLGPRQGRVRRTQRPGLSRPRRRMPVGKGWGSRLGSCTLDRTWGSRPSCPRRLSR